MIDVETWEAAHGTVGTRYVGRVGTLGHLSALIVTLFIAVCGLVALLLVAGIWAIGLFLFAAAIAALSAGP